MLDLTTLLEKIPLGESSALEFKSVRIAGNKIKGPGRGDLSDEIAAFANHHGGVIVFGVSDDGEIQGVSAEYVKTLTSFISEICHDSIEPPVVNFFMDSVPVPDEAGSKKILVYIDVSRSLWLHQSAGGFFSRQGNAKRKMTTEQLGRLLQSRSQARIVRFDEQVVPNTGKSTLRRDLYARFIRETKSEEEENGRLLKRRLLVEEQGDLRVSVAGLLMCSEQSADYLYNSFVCAVYYNGKEKDANYQIDAKDFTGPLDRQIVDSFKFVEKYNKLSARKDVGRIERPEYSMRAVFEALVNAVVHRDYSRHESKIRLFMFSDRLEIYSPGALANTLTVDTLRHNQATRNELLSRLLSEIEIGDGMDRQVQRAHFLERRGEGVAIILNESHRLSGKLPVYEMLGEELRLTIFAAKSLQEN